MATVLTSIAVVVPSTIWRHELGEGLASFLAPAFGAFTVR